MMLLIAISKKRYISQRRKAIVNITLGAIAFIINFDGSFIPIDSRAAIPDLCDAFRQSVPVGLSDPDRVSLPVIFIFPGSFVPHQGSGLLCEHTFGRDRRRSRRTDSATF